MNRSLALCLLSIFAVACGAPKTGTDGGTNPPKDGGNPDAGPGAPTVSLTVTAGYGMNQEGFAPALVGLQDGTSGAWTALSGLDGGYVFHVTDSAGRYRVAVVCTLPGSVYVHVADATVAELSALRFNCRRALDAQHATQFTAQATVNGAPTSAALWVGLDKVLLPINGTPSVAISEWPGTYDFFATQSSSTVFSHGVLLHDQPATNGGTVSVDFNASSAFAPEQHVVQLAASAADSNYYLSSELITRRGTAAGFPTAHTAGAGLVFVPSSALAPGDIHEVFAEAQGADGYLREVDHFMVDGGTLSLIGPAFLTSATVSVVQSSPRVSVKADWSGAPNGGTLYFTVGTEAEPYASYDYLVSPAALAGNATSSYSMPDLSALAGWDTAWDMHAGIPLGCSVGFLTSAQGLTGIHRDFPTLQFGSIPDGLEVSSTSRFVEMTP